MKQQINLLTDELRPSQEILPLRQLLTGLGGFAILLLILSGWQGTSLWQAHLLQQETISALHSAKEDNAAMQAREAAGPNQELVRLVAALRAERDDHRLLQLALDRLQTAGGFAGYLEDIAACHEPGMWLTRIRLEQGGAYVRLEGETRSADTLPRFLEGLSQGAQFAGHRFDGFEVESLPSGYLGFLLSGPEEA